MADLRTLVDEINTNWFPKGMCVKLRPDYEWQVVELRHDDRVVQQIKRGTKRDCYEALLCNSINLMENAWHHFLYGQHFATKGIGERTYQDHVRRFEVYLPWQYINRQVVLRYDGFAIFYGHQRYLNLTAQQVGEQLYHTARAEKETTYADHP